MTTQPKPSSNTSLPPRQIGIIGLGLLGGALAERALAGGVTVTGFDIESARRMEFVQAGGTEADSAQAVAKACGCILLVLPDDSVAGSVLESIAGVLRPDTFILDVTTGAPEAALAHEAELRRHGAVYLDATISGSSTQVRRGEALFMVGGAPEHFANCQALLESLAGRALHTGPCGSGARMKLVTNLVLGLNRAALAEGLVFARALGLDPALTLEVLQASAAASRVMESKGEKMLRAQFEPQARLSQHLKDVRLMLAAAAAAGQELPLSQTHRGLLELAEHLGCGPQDNSAIIRAIEARQHPAPPPSAP